MRLGRALSIRRTDDDSPGRAGPQSHAQTPLNTDPDVLDKIMEAISRANSELPQELQPGQLAEQDCYLRAEAKAPITWLESDAALLAERLELTLAGARNLAPHASASKILRQFGQ